MISPFLVLLLLVLLFFFFFSFSPPSNNVETENNNVKTDLASENIDNDKSILGAPPKQDKKEVKNIRAKKTNSQKPK